MTSSQETPSVFISLNLTMGNAKNIVPCLPWKVSVSSTRLISASRTDHGTHTNSHTSLSVLRWVCACRSGHLWRSTGKSQQGTDWNCPQPLKLHQTSQRGVSLVSRDAVVTYLGRRFCNKPVTSSSVPMLPRIKRQKLFQTALKWQDKKQFLSESFQVQKYCCAHT